MITPLQVQQAGQRRSRGRATYSGSLPGEIVRILIDEGWAECFASAFTEIWSSGRFPALFLEGRMHALPKGVKTGPLGHRLVHVLSASSKLFARVLCDMVEQDPATPPALPHAVRLSQGPLLYHCHGGRAGDSARVPAGGLPAHARWPGRRASVPDGLPPRFGPLGSRPSGLRRGGAVPGSSACP